MEWENIGCLVVVLGLLIYLMYALVYPEKF